MQSKKKMIVNTVFLVVIFALTIYGVFHGEDLGAMMEAMRRADVRWLLPGLFCVVFFIWGESIIIWYMMHSFQIPVKRRTCFLFSSVGFFFSCITPSASGGQPMQLYYMKKEKISLPVSTVILMIVTITYKAVLVVVGLGLVLFGQGFLHRYLTEILPVFYLGIGLNVFCVTAMLILVFHPALARTILVLGLKIVEKLHLMKRKESRLKKLEASMEVYQNTAAYLGTHKMVLVNVLAITFVQRFALFAATWFVYRAFHLSGISFITIVLLFTGGMPLFDSVCHGMGIAGTGGFGNWNNSIAHYNSAYLQNVISVFMILFGINFNAYFLLLTRKFKQLFKIEEIRVYLGVIAVFTTLIAFNVRGCFGSLRESFHHSLFQVASIITTTGFSTVDFNQWPAFSKLLLVLLMFIGACAGSTGGGMKCSRILLLFKGVKKEMMSLIHPRLVRVHKMDGQRVQHEVMRSVNAFLVAYLIVIATSVLIVSLHCEDMVTSFTSVVT